MKKNKKTWKRVTYREPKQFVPIPLLYKFCPLPLYDPFFPHLIAYAFWPSVKSRGTNIISNSLMK